MSGSTRRQFSAAFELKVIDFAEANGNMAAQCQFGVSEKCVRYWRAQKKKLLCVNHAKCPFEGVVRFPQLDDTLTDFVRKQRARSLLVTTHAIRCKAVELAREAGLPREEFRDPSSWVCIAL